MTKYPIWYGSSAMYLRDGHQIVQLVPFRWSDSLVDMVHASDSAVWWESRGVILGAAKQNTEVLIQVG